MTKILKWVFTHEPAIVAGLMAGVAVFFSLHYGTKADGALQGTTGGLVTALFGVLRNFVTSPATKQAISTGQANLPAIVSDVQGLKDALGGLVAHPGGLEAWVLGHIGSIRKEVADLFSREQQVAQPIITVGTLPGTSIVAGQDSTLKPVAEPVPAPASEAATEPVDHLAVLATLVPADGTDHLAKLAALS